MTVQGTAGPFNSDAEGVERFHPLFFLVSRLNDSGRLRGMRSGSSHAQRMEMEPVPFVVAHRIEDPAGGACPALPPPGRAAVEVESTRVKAAARLARGQSRASPWCELGAEQLPRNERATGGGTVPPPPAEVRGMGSFSAAIGEGWNRSTPTHGDPAGACRRRMSRTESTDRGWRTLWLRTLPASARPRLRGATSSEGVGGRGVEPFHPRPAGRDARGSVPLHSPTERPHSEGVERFHPLLAGQAGRGWRRRLSRTAPILRASSWVE